MTEEPAGRTSPIGERIRAQRMLRGLSQADLAARVGRSLLWVDRLEHGDLEWVGGLECGRVDAAEVPVLADLAVVLGVRVEHLVDPSASAEEVAQDRERDRTRPLVPVRRPRRRREETPPAPRSPAASAPRRPSVPVRLIAAGAGIGVATGCVAIGVGLSRGAAPAADHGLRSPASASARLGTQPSPTAASSPAATDAPATPPPTAVAAATLAPAAPAPPRPAAAPPARRVPAPAARPAVRVAVATPSPQPGRIKVFPEQVGVIVRAGSANGPTVTFTVSDPGPGPVTLGAIALSNPAAHVVSDTCSHATLAPQDVCDVTLRFAAAKAGWYGGALVLPVVGQAATRIPITVYAEN